MSKEITRLHQPNLTCSFDVTMTDDNNLWNLVMKNKDNAGITDQQMIQCLWDFACHFTQALMQQKLWSIKQGEAIPEAHAFITHDKRYVTWNVIVQAVDKPLNESSFSIYLGELAKQFAEKAGVKLQGISPANVESSKRSPDANL